MDLEIKFGIKQKKSHEKRERYKILVVEKRGQTTGWQLVPLIKVLKKPHKCFLKDVHSHKSIINSS